MRRYALVVLLAALAMTAGLAVARASLVAQEWAVVNFKDPVLVGKYFLMGRHLILHDQEMMARGEPCTWIYEGSTPKPEKLVVAFHCRPIKRKPATGLTLSLVRLPSTPGVQELTEYQFAGSDEGHGVPQREVRNAPGF